MWEEIVGCVKVGLVWFWQSRLYLHHISMGNEDCWIVWRSYHIMPENGMILGPQRWTLVLSAYQEMKPLSRETGVLELYGINADGNQMSSGLGSGLFVEHPSPVRCPVSLCGNAQRDIICDAKSELGKQERERWENLKQTKAKITYKWGS